MAGRFLKNYTCDELWQHAAEGGRFACYYYCLSFYHTIDGSSEVHVVKGRWDALKAGLNYTLMTFFLGWWGFPGCVMTPIYVIANLFGGHDVTAEILKWLEAHELGEDVKASLTGNVELPSEPMDPVDFLAYLEERARAGSPNSQTKI